MSYIIQNPKEFRENIQKKINSFVKNNRQSTNLEKAVFNFAIKESKIEKL